MKRIHFFFLSILLFSGCGGEALKNPSATLRETGRTSKVHLQAMDQMDLEVGYSDSSYQEQLERMIWVHGYTTEAREAALNRLWSMDRNRALSVIRQNLPRLSFDYWSWICTLCEWIAKNEVLELDEALISSWARPTSMASFKERPEYIALAQLFGEDEVVSHIFDSLVSSNKTWKQNYRIRCWELLLELAEKDILITLLNSELVQEDDFFLLDLRKALNDFGIVPSGKEEILWIRELAKSEYDSFWNDAVETLNDLSNERKEAIEMRDIPIAVSLRRHGSAAQLSKTTSEILRGVARQLDGAQHYYEHEGGGKFDSNSELFRTHRGGLDWGDAIALETALKALSVPQVRSHLFDYADRDFVDKSTEYGGVIALDDEGRFEVLEFEPRIRHHDRKYNAPQELFDAAYTALFHFHYHAQKHRNGDHAGPGMGDKNYATNTRANCLVLTYVNKNTLNVDYYRHTGVVVDLGIISRNK